MSGAGWGDYQAAGGFLFVELFLAVGQIEPAFVSGGGFGERGGQGTKGAAHFQIFLQNHGRALIDGG